MNYNELITKQKQDILDNEFQALALKAKSRENTIKSKIVEFLLTAKSLNVSKVKLEAKFFDTDKIHIQTFYSACDLANVKRKIKSDYTAVKVDNHYISEAIVNL